MNGGFRKYIHTRSRSVHRHKLPKNEVSEVRVRGKNSNVRDRRAVSLMSSTEELEGEGEGEEFQSFGGVLWRVNKRRHASLLRANENHILQSTLVLFDSSVTALQRRSVHLSFFPAEKRRFCSFDIRPRMIFFF